MAQRHNEESWGVGIRINRYQMLVPDLCSEPCERCGVHEDGKPVINIMPDGCVAPSAAVGGRRRCLECSDDYLLMDGQVGHLAWLKEPFGQGYMLFRIYNTKNGSDKHPDTNCVYRIPYTSMGFTFFPMQCIDCGRGITDNEHQDAIHSDSGKIAKGRRVTTGVPAIADSTDIDRKTWAAINKMAKQGGEVFVAGGTLEDAQNYLYAQIATAKLAADPKDLHKGHRYVLEKNDIAVFSKIDSKP